MGLRKGAKMVEHTKDSGLKARKDNPEPEYVDDRNGVYDAVNQQGKPQPAPVPVKTTPEEAAQWQSPIESEPDLSHPEPDLPEGLTRRPKGPLGPTTGRRQK
jgi:hypothetical protein